MKAFTVFASLYLILISTAYGCEVKYVNPNVEQVSTGPIHWDSEGHANKYRLIVVLSEVNLHVIAEKIVLGDENCCAKIVHRIDDIKGVPKTLYQIDSISWKEHDQAIVTSGKHKYEIGPFDKAEKGEATLKGKRK